jgi:geranylgeranyl diphosphate synthase type I
MSLKELSESMLPAVEAELQRVVARLDAAHTQVYHAMLTYHMGWTGEGAGPEAQGKRIRPLLVLLACAACGADWGPAVPAAAAVELIHNFSLVHDDIQDNSDLRRGRPTVWKKWGMPQAINAGDGLFVLAHLAVSDLEGKYPAETILKVAKILDTTCLDLTRGQHLDISYENRNDLTVEGDYWPMISGKTAALLAGCCEMGAVLGGADEAAQDAYRSFGQYLGLAFQVQDDLLGIWGDSALTGKSSESDLVAGKKSVPVLAGLSKKGAFAKRWAEGPIRPEEVPALAGELAAEGFKLLTQETADNLTDLALASLRTADPQGEAGEALFELAQKLLGRQA